MSRRATGYQEVQLALAVLRRIIFCAVSDEISRDPVVLIGRDSASGVLRREFCVGARRYAHSRGRDLRLMSATWRNC